jgi:alkaline phosphatase D
MLRLSLLAGVVGIPFGGSTEQLMDRRNFLRNTGFWTASLALTGGLSACGGDSEDEGLAQASGSDWQFPQSVASGDPAAAAITLWTRVVPASASATEVVSAAGDFAITLEITAVDNSSLLGSNSLLQGKRAVSSRIPVYAKYDHTIRNRVSGLSPATTYYYQFSAGSVRSKVGRFRTAPAVDADVAQLNFAFISCQDWSVNHWAGFSCLLEEDIDFIVHLGDYIYETVGESFQTGAVESLHEVLSLPDGTYKSGSSGAQYATSLADYRYLYKKYRSDPRLQAVHERFPFIATWDDHEFSDDCWQDAETYDIGTYDASTGSGDNTHQTTRRRSANQAWFEFMPAHVSYDSDTTSFQNVRIYRDLPFGKLAHFVVTDERLYRADHIVPEATPGILSSTGSRYFVPASVRDSFETAKMAAITSGDTLAPVSILGTTQREWWKRTMKGSGSTWKLWCNEVSLLRMGLNGTDAVATLLALNMVSSLASSIATAASSFDNSTPVAAAYVAAVTAGASSSLAGAGAAAIAGASGAASAGVSAGLSSSQATIAAAAYAAAAAAETASQAAAGAQVIAFAYIKPDIQANGASSSFVVALGLSSSLSAYFTDFLLSCDQWDGYNAERKALMSYLKSEGISNVVALTGDLHSFHAGTVNDDYDSSDNGTPVMVDFVTAGISSDSWFKYFSDATAGSLLSSLVYTTVSVAAENVGTLSINFNLFDFTLQRSAPTLDELAEQARGPVRRALGDAGVAESALDSQTDAVLATLKTSSSFNTTVLGLATQLAGLDSNPWITLMRSDAQGYAVVNLSSTTLTCTFRQLNPLVGTTAPSNYLAQSYRFAVTAGTAGVTRLS